MAPQVPAPTVARASLTKTWTDTKTQKMTRVVEEEVEGLLVEAVEGVVEALVAPTPLPRPDPPYVFHMFCLVQILCMY